MIYTISKGDVTVSVNSLGAELYSLKKGETEYVVVDGVITSLGKTFHPAFLHSSELGLFRL